MGEVHIIRDREMIQYKYMEEEDHFTQTQLPALIATLTNAALGSPSFSLLFSLLCSLSRCLFIGNNGGCQLQLFFNNGGCQPLTLGMGCCICQWTVPSINGCCTLMATNPIITPFAIHVGNCPLVFSTQACMLQFFQAYHSESVSSQVYRYLPHLSITRVTKAHLFLTPKDHYNQMVCHFTSEEC